MPPIIRGKVTTTKLPNDFFDKLRKSIHSSNEEINKKLAQFTSRRAKEIIRKQQFDWQPLDPTYKARKESLGLDERILIATKDYVNKGIGWWKSEKGWVAGPKNGTHKPSGLTYKHLAAIHEFGTDTIPARKLWRRLKVEVILHKRKLWKEHREKIRKEVEANKKRSTKKTRKF